ncbi:uncharacterized protein ATNIH1004_010938 [Aspergillus tanneri]|uniref:Uncharacterized protein n=1 Tax=Aspergillus tanneri TaxID=1220188 RepID=A0A5M9MBU9_9EURO|nr:uncharacterized protein ATNIH1004_010938 [Aspergillus tanneri]KAA8641999.1 hypothetical protein ATNIH1004_010938 [Aspergillus tanneri]
MDKFQVLDFAAGLEYLPQEPMDHVLAGENATQDHFQTIVADALAELDPILRKIFQAKKPVDTRSSADAVGADFIADPTFAVARHATLYAR